MAVTRYVGDKLVGLDNERYDVLWTVSDGANYYSSDSPYNVYIKQNGDWQQISGGGSGTGTSGSSGSSGADGTSGTSGSSGINGTSGSSGADGTSGTSGSSGVDGNNGTSGSSGVDGT